MSALLTFLIVIAVLVGLAGYAWYVSLIQRRNRAREALSSIDVQLRKRHDLLPNLLKLANHFMAHERELLSQLTALRSQVQQPYDAAQPEAVRQHLRAEGELQAGLRRLFAVAEGYPELRSSETVVQAQQSFNAVEGHIAAARRFYNASVTRLNNSVEIFPGSVIARMAGIQALPFFEIEEASARQPVDVNAWLTAAGPAAGTAPTQEAAPTQDDP